MSKQFQNPNTQTAESAESAQWAQSTQSPIQPIVPPTLSLFSDACRNIPVQHLDPIYETNAIHRQRTMCQLELDSITKSDPRTNNRPKMADDGRVFVTDCPLMSKDDLTAIIRTIDTTNGSDPFDFRSDLYREQWIRMPFSSKCQQSLVGLAANRTADSKNNKPPEAEQTGQTTESVSDIWKIGRS